MERPANCARANSVDRWFGGGKPSLVDRVCGGLLALALIMVMLTASPPPAVAAVCTGNAIACENEKDGTPREDWDIDGIGDEACHFHQGQQPCTAGAT